MNNNETQLLNSVLAVYSTLMLLPDTTVPE